MNIKTLNKIAMTMAVAIAAAACSGGDKAKEEKKADDTMNVEVAKTDYREVDQVNSFTGTVEADVTNNIAPQSPMRIRKVYVEVGQHVSAGQKLADMDPANLDQVRLQMENNHLEFKRVDELFKIGGCSKSEWDAKKMAYDISRRNYENLAENTRLISPISGVVSQRNYDSGDMYSGASPIFVVEKIRPVKMKVNVSESLFTKIKKGMNVDFTLDVYGDEVFTGKVNIVYPTVDPHIHRRASDSQCRRACAPGNVCPCHYQSRTRQARCGARPRRAETCRLGRPLCVCCQGRQGRVPQSGARTASRHRI